MYLIKSGSGYVHRKTNIPGQPIIVSEKKAALEMGFDEAMEICTDMHESGLGAVMIRSDRINKTIDHEDRMSK